METTMRSGRVVAALAALTVVFVGIAPAAAQANARPTIRSCADLAGIYRIAGALTHVEKGTTVEGATPAYCDVTGYVEPAVAFELKLPITTFNGRYVQYGVDGFGGAIQARPFPAPCPGPQGGNFAIGSTNDGHIGQQRPIPLADGSWAADNQAARDDWFFRAPHVVSKAAKAIIAAYYGAGPRQSYFNGCSTGGREALLLAQRYPYDFDGIIAGAPINNMSAYSGIYQAWSARVNTAPDGSSILTVEKLGLLHNAVIAACDGLDGLVDGQLDEPRDCHFDPQTLLCPTGTDRPSCLTPAQVDTIRKLYGGPVDAHGRRLYPGWAPYGSELQWNVFIVPLPFLGAPFAGILADNYLKYVGFPIGTPHSSVADVEFTVKELRKLTPEGVKGNALSLDLGRFRRAGGKLILWNGWADPNVTPIQTVDYYGRLTWFNGGLARTERFARLFVVPSVYHCGLGGEKLNTFDPFPQLVDWVESGHAPDRIIAVERNSATDPIIRSRPVFPYPLRARYDGTGSTDDAANFVPAPPLRRHDDVIRWAGTDLYFRPGPVAP